MSDFFLNEHSLHGQYSQRAPFLNALRGVMGAKDAIERTGFSFYCDTGIRLRNVIGEFNFEQVVRTSGNKELLRIVLAWLSKTGPFWAAEQLHSPEDLFSCMDDDVTGSTLAEAACRCSADTPCTLFGFSPSKFCCTPLVIVWRRNTGGEVDVPVENFWELLLLNERLASLTPIKEWPELLTWAQRNSKHLLLSDDVIEPILHEPFSRAAAAEIQNLLKILDEISESYGDSGTLNAHGAGLVQLYFQGHHPRFSDESPNPKFDFTHPLNNQKVRCSWHGQVRLGCQYRIHFQWPKPRGARLWVAYIGPKLIKW